MNDNQLSFLCDFYDPEEKCHVVMEFYAENIEQAIRKVEYAKQTLTLLGETHKMFPDWRGSNVSD